MFMSSIKLNRTLFQEVLKLDSFSRYQLQQLKSLTVSLLPLFKVLSTSTNSSSDYKAECICVATSDCTDTNHTINKDLRVPGDVLCVQQEPVWCQ